MGQVVEMAEILGHSMNGRRRMCKREAELESSGIDQRRIITRAGKAHTVFNHRMIDAEERSSNGDVVDERDIHL